MLTIFLFILFLARLIFDNQLISKGASTGLMLWYQKVLPLLLPFLILSSIFSSIILNYSKKRKELHLSTPAIVILGFFCGCPIGAKTTAFFYQNNQINKSHANYLLPLCNNISPMFLAGYITVTILHNSVAFYMVLLLIYIPYLLYAVLSYPFFHSKTKNNPNPTPRQSQAQKDSNDIALTSIIQITYIGLYIMLCSIIIEFIQAYVPISNACKYILASVTELTTGSNLLAKCNVFDPKTKTALILGLTSFGGISTILQTKKAIQDTKLSIVYYTVVKSICALTTYLLARLIL